jgi:hypothetical protein
MVSGGGVSVYDGIGHTLFRKGCGAVNAGLATFSREANRGKFRLIRPHLQERGTTFMIRRSTRFCAHAFMAGVFAVVCVLAPVPGYGQSGPFASLIGSWAGAGTIKLAEGGSERLKCKASYDSVSTATVQLRLLCASDSYKFDLLGSMTASGSTISGSWTESTRNVAGTISGTISGGTIAVNTSGALTAGLTLSVTGGRQTVSLRSKGTSIESVSITMTRA